jgi:undecaprenyl-diphosphatase
MLNSGPGATGRGASVRRADGAGPARRAAVLVAVATLIGFTLLTVVVLGLGVDGWDRAALRAVERLHGRSLTKAVKTITALGTLELVAPLTIVVVGAAMLLRRLRAAALMVLAVVGADLLQLGLKPLFDRPRPHVFPHLEQIGSAAYPSGHAIVSAALAFALVAICWRRPWRAAAASVAAVYVLAVGFSRIYLGVHYPSDVLGGWLLAAAWVSILCAALGPALLRSGRRAAAGEAQGGHET